MKRRLIYGFVTVALLVNLGLGARLYFATANAAEKDSAYANMELFSFVMEKVRKDYVDGKDLTYRELVFHALDGMVGKLDPHSEFLDPEKYKELQDDTQGQFGGLGIIVQLRDGFITVITPIEDTPGFRAGILAGDRILKVDGKATEKKELGDVVKTMRGEPGTEVTVTIFRPSNGETKELTLKRAVINVDMVKDVNGKKDFTVDENKIGYARIVQFGERTGTELESALKKMKAQNLQGFVLDLRWNPGGLLDQAVEVCEKFLPRGQLVVSTEGRDAAQKSVHKAAGRGDALKGVPMVVLINIDSASASEIVAGCLQDLNRAVVIGEKSFGKGSVQSIFPLDGGAALRLTTAKYYTPSHKVIHGEGITPNIVVAMSREEENDILAKRAPGGIESLEGADRERVANARDPQLERALDVLKGINLFTQRLPATRLVSRGKWEPSEAALNR
ncbi:MAG: S41 family peptidase [Verrucomicrobia bacterium]|nr:MAG: S41 family peptidase [Verrucomicrobiota bacterium]